MEKFRTFYEWFSYIFTGLITLLVIIGAIYDVPYHALYSDIVKGLFILWIVDVIGLVGLEIFED